MDNQRRLLINDTSNADLSATARPPISPKMVKLMIQRMLEQDYLAGRLLDINE